MAVSQTLLRQSHPNSFLVMIGRDHRVLVLEDCAGRDAAGLPHAFVWLKNPVDYWFRSSTRNCVPFCCHPDDCCALTLCSCEPFSAFLKAFFAAVAPYSRASAERKQQWDSDFEADFSEWRFLETMMGSAVPRLNEAKERATAEFERRKQP